MARVPNAISVLRALATVPLVLAMDGPNGQLLALAIFALAAFTDAVDGTLARRLRATSALGAFLDPLADKVLVLVTLGALRAHGAVDTLPVGLIVAREVVVTAVRAVAVWRGLPVRSSAYGKAKAALQAGAVGTLLAAGAWPALGLDPLADAVLWATVAVTLVSGADVIRRAAAMLATSTPGAVRVVDAR